MNIARWFRVRRIRRNIRRAKAALNWIDRQMARLGCPAQKRQQMRRDIITSDKAWIDALDLLVDEKRGPSKRAVSVIQAALETVEEKR